ncbi:MAG: hypothetical protein QNJ78_08035 [Gammaproteobacteria bacterium]|nr:hypothetical protein [Gammaproteobacteria bacterium]
MAASSWDGAHVVTGGVIFGWLALVEAVGDSDPSNDTATGSTRVVPRRELKLSA